MTAGDPFVIIAPIGYYELNNPAGILTRTKALH